MGSFRVLNFGCRANQADGAALQSQLLDEGWHQASGPEACDVALLNTCTVTATADAELRKIVRRIHRQNPRCKILVTGCYAQRAPAELAALDGVHWVVGNSHKQQIRELFQKTKTSPANGLTSSAGFFPLDRLQDRNSDSGDTSVLPETPRAKILVGDIFEQQELMAAPVYGKEKTRPTLKIQDGCNARCSYCIIPYVRGRSRSLPPEKVLVEVRRLLGNGTQEIVLSGINLGSYGKDLTPRIRFLDLLERILSETSLPRLRISSIEPMDVSKEVIRLVRSEPRMAKHFHIPLQSGCDRILRQMNRRYWAAQYAERVIEVRESIPEAAIGADVMVGFPRESDEDHQTSARFIASLPFTYLHVFPYSIRSGTAAAELPGQLNGRIARERSREIRTAMAAKRAAFMKSQVGCTLSVVTLEESSGDTRFALSSNFLKVALPEAGLRANRLIEVGITGYRDNLLLGFYRASIGLPSGMTGPLEA